MFMLKKWLIQLFKFLFTLLWLFCSMSNLPLLKSMGITRKLDEIFPGMLKSFLWIFLDISFQPSYFGRLNYYFWVIIYWLKSITISDLISSSKIIAYLTALSINQISMQRNKSPDCSGCIILMKFFGHHCHIVL